MWLFSKDSTTNFPFNRSSENELNLLNGWILSNATNKKGEEFSLFVHDLLTADSFSKANCQNCLKRMKTLKHPDLINFVDVNESQKEILIVTEKVVPLEKYLREKSDSGNFPFIASWGLFQILRGLVFLNSTCKCNHNQVRLSSVFVNKSGDWKLGAFDFVSNANDSPPNGLAQTDIYWPPDHVKFDSYGFGCLVWETFNRNLNRKTDLKELSRLPGQIVKLYQKLIHPKSNIRIGVENALKELTGPCGFSDNFYVKTLIFLEEIQIKEQEEKQKFMTSLTDLVDSFPDDIAKYKILPHLLTCHQYGAAGIEVLVPLVKLGKLLEQSEFETSVVPRLVAMFRSSNRSTRVRLLEQLPSFIDSLPYKVVDLDIFPAVVLGLTDTNPVVREATIRSVVHLAPKLGHKSLNEVLVNHLMNLQLKDEQGGIRTNATVCLAKIAHLMSSQTRQNTLLNSLLRCTRDPFVPAKLSAVSALAASQHLFLINDVATKLIPCLSFLTVDPEKEVRDQTFKAIEFAVSRLKEASENPESSKTISLENKEAQNSISWKNWAVSFIKKSEASQAVNHKGDPHQSPERSQKKNNIENVKKGESYSTVKYEEKEKIEEKQEPKEEKESEDDNDEWAPIEDMNFGQETTKMKSNTRWDYNPDDFFDNLIRENNVTTTKSTLKLTKKPIEKRKNSASNEDGWGDVDW